MTDWHGNSGGADDGDEPAFRIRDLLPAAVLALLGLVGLVVATLSMNAAPGQYLVVAARWQGREKLAEMVWRAGGGVAGFGGLSSVVVAMGDGPGFAETLRAQWACIVLPSPRGLGCFTAPDGGGHEGWTGQAAGKV